MSHFLFFEASDKTIACTSASVLLLSCNSLWELSLFLPTLIFEVLDFSGCLFSWSVISSNTPYKGCYLSFFLFDLAGMIASGSTTGG